MTSANVAERPTKTQASIHDETDGPARRAARASDDLRAPFSRQPALDGIRGLAIAMVLLGHAYGVLPGLAAAGVGLFFVLSGFLITTILLKEHERDERISLPRFYARRALRLLPALAVLLTAAVVYMAVATDGTTRSNLLRSLWTSATYVSNWFQALGQPYEPSLGHTWSLATEEQFYLIWPLLLLALCTLRRRPKLVVGILLSMIAGAAVLRGVLHVYESPIKGGLYFSPFTWADSLLIGCLAGVSFSWRLRSPRASGPALVVALSFAAVAIASGNGDLMFFGGATALGACFATIIWGALEPGPLTRVLGRPMLVRLGRISYGTYLWQGPFVWMAGRRWDGAPKVFVGTFAITASLLAASLSFRFVETPFLRVKDRLASARRKSVDEDPPTSLPKRAAP